jgi:hypothetical protein
MAIWKLVNPEEININRILNPPPAPSQEQAQKKAQEEPQEEARGEKVARAEPNQDMETPKLNASVEGLGLFRLQLGSGQLRPTVSGQGALESPKRRGFLVWIIRILQVLTLLLSIAAVALAIWLWVQGKSAPPFISTSFKVVGFSLIGSVLALGGVTLFSLQIRLNKMEQQIAANQRRQQEPRAKEEGGQRPEFVIASPNRPTLHFKARDDKILSQLEQIGNKSSDIEWAEKCLEDEEITNQIKKTIENLETGRQRVVKLLPDREHEGIAVTFETEYRIPVKIGRHSG